MGDGGKGSAPRPFSVSQQEFSANWDRIFHQHQPSQQPPQASPDVNNKEQNNDGQSKNN